MLLWNLLHTKISFNETLNKFLKFENKKKSCFKQNVIRCLVRYLKIKDHELWSQKLSKHIRAKHIQSIRS